MKIQLDKNEIHLVGYHLNLFIEPIFKGFESKYPLKGFFQKRIYKSLSNKIAKSKEGTVKLNKKEVDMLLRFLTWYTKHAQEFDATNGNLSVEFSQIAENIKSQAA